MIKGLQYGRGATAPNLALWLFDDDGELIDLSTADLSLRIGDRGVAALKEKTSGLVGAAGTGNAETDGSIPNLFVVWASGDLDVPPGEYTLQITADSGSNTPRYFFRDIEILDIVLAP